MTPYPLLLKLVDYKSESGGNGRYQKEISEQRNGYAQWFYPCDDFRGLHRPNGQIVITKTAVRRNFDSTEN